MNQEETGNLNTPIFKYKNNTIKGQKSEIGQKLNIRGYTILMAL